MLEMAANAQIVLEIRIMVFFLDYAFRGKFMLKIMLAYCIIAYSRTTLVAGPPPSFPSSRQCRDISNFPEAQGSLTNVDLNTVIMRTVQKEHVPWN